VSEEDTQRNGGATGKGFAKGKSGNPGGTPKWLRQVREGLRELAPEGLKVVRRIYSRANDVSELERIIQDGESSPEAVLKAEAALHDRLELAHKVNAESWKYLMPKPTQRHKVSGQLDGNPLREVTTEEIQAFLKRGKEGEGK